MTPYVAVHRWSHRGFAYGSEGGCGGAMFLWHRTPAGWRTLLAYQETPSCDDSATVRRAMTVLGLECWEPDGSGSRQLGSWPESGR